MAYFTAIMRANLYHSARHPFEPEFDLFGSAKAVFNRCKWVGIHLNRLILPFRNMYAGHSANSNCFLRQDSHYFGCASVRTPVQHCVISNFT